MEKKVNVNDALRARVLASLVEVLTEDGEEVMQTASGTLRTARTAIRSLMSIAPSSRKRRRKPKPRKPSASARKPSGSARKPKRKRQRRRSNPPLFFGIFLTYDRLEPR